MSIYTYELCDISAIVIVPPTAMDACLGRFMPSGLFDYVWQPLKDGDVWQGYVALMDKRLECDLDRPHWEKRGDGDWKAEIDWVGRDLCAIDELHAIEEKVKSLGGRVEY